MEPIGNSFRGNSYAVSARFDARLDAFPAALEFTTNALRHAGISPELIARSELVIEELFRNSVLHGYGGDSSHPIWIGVEAHGAGSDGSSAAPCFWYEDEAPAYDPLAADVQDAGAVKPIEQQAVGGIGLLLIHQLPTQVEYFYRDGRNRIVVTP